MIPYEENITADNTYTLAAPFTGSDYILYASGVFDGATCTFGYIDGSEVFAAGKGASDEDLVVSGSVGYIVVAPPSKLLAVKVEGTTASSSIKLNIAHRKG